MKTIFNKALWASAIGACTLSLGSCTDLSETIYDTIASEKYEYAKMYKDELHRRGKDKEDKAE